MMVPTTTTAGTASRVQHIIIYNKNLAMMTSASLSSADEWRAAIDMDGYICLTDSGVGLRAEEFAKKGWPRTNLDGLKFLKAHTLDDARIVEIHDSALPGSKVGAYMLLHPFYGRILCFLAPNKRERQTLAILVWGKGSKVILYKGSHKLSVQPAEGDLMELSPKQLATSSVSPTTISLEDGGFTIFDGRLGFTIIDGVAVALVSAVPERLKTWKALKLPNTLELKTMMADMSHSTIGFNFEFDDSEDAGLQG